MSSAKKKQADARRVVLDLLMDSGDFPTRQFGDFADRAGLEGQDRGFARELLSGTLRHCRKLDAIFEPHCKRRVKDEALRWTLTLFPSPHPRPCCGACNSGICPTLVEGVVRIC